MPKITIEFSHDDLNILDRAFFWCDVNNGLQTKKFAKDFGYQYKLTPRQKEAYKKLKQIFNKAWLDTEKSKK